MSDLAPPDLPPPPPVVADTPPPPQPPRKEHPRELTLADQPSDDGDMKQLKEQLRGLMREADADTDDARSRALEMKKEGVRRMIKEFGVTPCR